MLDTAPKARLVVHNPLGYPPKVARKTPAGRLDTLDGRTIYLVDVRFDDSIELLRQVEAWFHRHMPSVTTRLNGGATGYSYTFLSEDNEACTILIN